MVLYDWDYNQDKKCWTCFFDSRDDTQELEKFMKETLTGEYFVYEASPLFLMSSDRLRQVTLSACQIEIYAKEDASAFKMMSPIEMCEYFTGEIC